MYSRLPHLNFLKFNLKSFPITLVMTEWHTHAHTHTHTHTHTRTHTHVFPFSHSLHTGFALSSWVNHPIPSRSSFPSIAHVATLWLLGLNSPRPGSLPVAPSSGCWSGYFCKQTKPQVSQVKEFSTFHVWKDSGLDSLKSSLWYVGPVACVSWVS